MEKRGSSLIYTGIPLPKKAEEKNLMPYLPSYSLVRSVNLAIFLGRPLLLMGEPGCGKTRLAEIVACELGLDYKDWYITSTSKAKDGLYKYDALRRLHDAQIANVSGTDLFGKPANYISKEVLWHAFESKDPTVVLIDEIDKADIDFPNDLLRLLDENKFKVDETGEVMHTNPKSPPIIFITSNGEKPLPQAFLRRCLFHYIDFPDSARLMEITKLHFPDVSTELATAAVTKFMKLRSEIKRNKGESVKKPSTGEFLDWLKVLILGNSKAKFQDLSDWFRALYSGTGILEVVSFLQDSDDIPFPETLLKDKENYSS